MAEEVEMTPVAAAEPPKANPLAKPAAPKVPTIKLAPVAHKPVIGGAAAGALKPGLKLPAQNGLKPGLKLPPKPGATVSTLRPGLKLPTQTALKPGVKLPAKPVIRKPGATVTAQPLPKPIVGAPKPTVPAATVNAAKPAAEKPLAEPPKPMEQLKAVTQKLKGITQEIPQQAILRKTGIIAETAMTDAQKEAAKHKTARISLSDAMGVAPVKNENAPMKTIRIKRPVGLGAVPAAPAAAAPAAAAPAAKPAEAESAAEEKPKEKEKNPLIGQWVFEGEFVRNDKAAELLKAAENPRMFRPTD